MSLSNYRNIFLILIIFWSPIKSDTELKPQPLVDTETAEKSFFYNEIVNKHDFKYKLNPEYSICKNNGENLFLLVYVHTAPNHLKKRMAIRETWAKKSMFIKMRILFMMGDTIDSKLNSLLQYESDTYGDIVQEDFHDSYKNLTYKGIMALKWISTYCSNVKYVLKVDDDIIINIFVLWKHLKSLEKYKIVKPKTIMCNVWTAMKVMRDKNSKWYLSEDEFKEPIFGWYCSGSAYILTGDLVKIMYETSFYVKFFWVDDYYISGLLARAANATYEFYNSLYIIHSGLVEQRFKGKQADFTVFGHLPEHLNRLYGLWSFILTRYNSYYSNFPNEINEDFVITNEYKWSYNTWLPFLNDPYLFNPSYGNINL